MKKISIAIVVAFSIVGGAYLAIAAPTATPPSGNLPNATFNRISVSSNIDMQGSLGKVKHECSYTCPSLLTVENCVLFVLRDRITNDLCKDVINDCEGNNNVFLPENASTVMASSYVLKRQCVLPATLASGIEFADKTVKTSSVGNFIGTSKNPKNGKIQGYVNAEKECKDAFPQRKGVHVCSHEEMLNTVLNFNRRKVYEEQLSNKDILWLNGPPSPYSTGDTVGLTADCRGWTSDSYTDFANVWSFRSNMNHAIVAPCALKLKFACCAY